MRDGFLSGKYLSQICYRNNLPGCLGGKAGSSQGLGIGDGEEVDLGNIKEVYCL